MNPFSIRNTPFQALESVDQSGHSRALRAHVGLEQASVIHCFAIRLLESPCLSVRPFVGDKICRIIDSRIIHTCVSG